MPTNRQRPLSVLGWVAAFALVVAALLTIVLRFNLTGESPIRDCGYRAEEIIGRLQALHVADSQRAWLTHEAFVAGSIGFFLAAALRWGSSWRGLSITIGALLLLAVLVEVIGLETVPEVVVLATVGLLIPAWAIVLARRDPEAP